MYGWPSCTHKIFENFPFLKMQIFEIFGDVRIPDYREKVSILTRCVKDEWEE